MKNKILSLIIAVCILVLPLTVISFAGEQKENTIINSAFYVELPEDFELSYISEDEYNEEYGTGFTYTIYDEDDYDSFESIYISVLENKNRIDNIEEDIEEANKFFYSILLNYAYISNGDQLFSPELSELNGYKCIKYKGVDVVDAGSMNEEIYYYTGYVFATNETVYSILLENDAEDLSFGQKLVDSFTMNGTLLKGDSHKNLVDFTGAEDYKEQVATYNAFGSGDFNFLDEETNKFARIGIIMFMIPFFILFVVTVIVIVKYSKNKKVLEEYESRYGIMGMGMSPYMNNMNYGAPINNSYMPTQPMQQPIQPTQPINQNYQAPTDNNGQNNNF